MSDRLDIHAYVDGELDSCGCKEVEAKLKECCETQAEEAAIRHLKAAVRTHCQEPECGELWKSCCKRLDELDKVNRVESFVGKYAWGLVGAFLLVIVGAAGMNRNAGPSLRTGDIPRITAGLAEIAAPLSQSDEEKRRWFDGVLQSDVKVHPVQLAVIGGRSGKTADGRQVTLMKLADNSGPLSLVVIEQTNRVEGIEPMGGSTTFYQTKINNLNAVAWMDNGSFCFLVGDRECPELCNIAQQIAQ